MHNKTTHFLRLMICIKKCIIPIKDILNMLFALSCGIIISHCIVFFFLRKNSQLHDLQEQAKEIVRT